MAGQILGRPKEEANEQRFLFVLLVSSVSALFHGPRSIEAGTSGAESRAKYRFGSGKKKNGINQKQEVKEEEEEDDEEGK